MLCARNKVCILCRQKKKKKSCRVFGPFCLFQTGLIWIVSVCFLYKAGLNFTHFFCDYVFMGRIVYN